MRILKIFIPAIVFLCITAVCAIICNFGNVVVINANQSTAFSSFTGELNVNTANQIMYSLNTFQHKCVRIVGVLCFVLFVVCCLAAIKRTYVMITTDDLFKELGLKLQQIKQKEGDDEKQD